MLLVASGAVAALVVVATAVGLLQRWRTGRSRSATGDAVDPASLGIDAPLGERVTFVQFSTAFCAACRPTARLLAEVRAATPGAVHLEVRLDERPHLADRFAVRQAPTTLLLDASGEIRARIVGVPRRDELQRTVTDLLEEPRARRP